MTDNRDPLELFLLVAEKPGMFVHAKRFDVVWGFIEGFDTARAGAPLKGFREWLVLQRGAWSNLAWFMLIRERVFPDSDPGLLPEPHEHEALLAELRSTLAAFRRDLDREGLSAILQRYQPLHDSVVPR